MQNLKHLRTALLLSLVASACAPVILAQQNSLASASKRGFKHDEKMISKYDKFKDETTLGVAGMDVYKKTGYPTDDRITFSVVKSFKGQQIKAPDSVFFIFNSYSDKWKYLRGNTELLVIADGERLSLGNFLRADSDIHSGYRSVYVEETLGGEVPFETFLKLSKARTVEMKLGYAEFQLKDKHMEALRDLVSRMAN